MIIQMLTTMNLSTVADHAHQDCDSSDGQKPPSTEGKKILAKNMPAAIHLQQKVSTWSLKQSSDYLEYFNIQGNVIQKMNLSSKLTQKKTPPPSKNLQCKKQKRISKSIVN